MYVALRDIKVNEAASIYENDRKYNSVFCEHKIIVLASNIFYN